MTVELGRIAFVDVFTPCIALVAFVASLRFEINAIWLVLGGAVAGVAVKAITG